jgi:hypothetical protein
VSTRRVTPESAGSGGVPPSLVRLTFTLLATRLTACSKYVIIFDGSLPSTIIPTAAHRCSSDRRHSLAISDAVSVRRHRTMIGWREGCTPPNRVAAVFGVLVWTISSLRGAAGGVFGFDGGGVRHRRN